MELCKLHDVTKEKEIPNLLILPPSEEGESLTYHEDTG